MMDSFNGTPIAVVASTFLMLLISSTAQYAVSPLQSRLSSSSLLAESPSLATSFIRCFTAQHQGMIYTRDDDESSLLFDEFYTSSINNVRFLNSTGGRPILIVAASRDAHVQSAVVCGRKTGLRLRVRSGGHDFEGLSYREVDESGEFFMLDLSSMRSITVDAQQREAWVEAGATLGELYYSISKASPFLGFPAGICPTVGVGGHISGGGAGTLLRKYGLAADNVLDARVVDVQGRVLDRKSMGEDLFWALRGGGGASFGVVLAFHLRLVEVTPTVTVFSVSKNRSQDAVGLVTKWQHIAYRLPDDLYIRISIGVAKKTCLTSNCAVQATFMGQLLGERQQLLSLVNKYFPDLGLTEDDCKEMSYLESVHFLAGYQGRPLTDLLDRTPGLLTPIKVKQDYLNSPISRGGCEEIFDELLRGQSSRYMDLDPYGGRVYDIPESSIPFPHRNGIVFKISYMWGDDDAGAAVSGLRNFFRFMTPFVSKNPRRAYINMKDLDLGLNREVGKATYEEAIMWGSKYFKGNFLRLAIVKASVDPDNYFWNEQSIPPYNDSAAFNNSNVGLAFS